jgi:ketosteroid isomerase-like protein
MKRIVFAVGLVVLVFGVAILAQTQTESAEQELIKLETEWNNNALVKHDWAFIDGILADDYITTDSDGVVANKLQEMAILKSGEEAVTYGVADDFRIRVYGDAAVVTYRWTYKGQVKGKGSSGQERYTDTWVKRGGRWQCVAVHASRIAQK